MPEETDGCPVIPLAAHLQSTVGLVWRALLLWMFLLLLLSVAVWMG
jgi:adenosylcobinamide-phosphate synthase